MLLVSGSVKLVSRLSVTYPGKLGHITTPRNNNGVGSLAKTGLPWAVDNGAFSGFDPAAFRRRLRLVAGRPRLLWVVCPDVVADAGRTVTLYREWEPELRNAGVPVAFVLQDGQERYELPDADCYFIGGSTAWKLSRHAAALAAEGKRRGAWLHMGRCNTRRRVQTAHEMGCDSVDGSIYSRMSDKFLLWMLRWLTHLEKQPVMFQETTP